MVVLAVSVCTKSGKRIPKSRIDSLLASFPKLIPPGSQHTTVETSDVRFVYQPFEELYVLLVTNKGSNILQDINTLSLVVRLISSLTPVMSEPAIVANAFELLCAFDEVVSLGYKENVSLQQVRNVLEGESHEEKIQEIIARNKEAEAKEELKRRAKQLEMQRREQQRLRQAGGSSAGGFNGMGPNGLGAGGMAGGYSSVPRFDPPPVERDPYRSASPASAAVPAKPVFKGSGMKLGKKGKTTNDLLDALGHEAVVPLEEDLLIESAPSSAPVSAAPAASAGHNSSAAQSILPKVDQESVHVTIKEHISASVLRDGGLNSLEVKGELELRITDPTFAKVKLNLAPASDRVADLGRDLTFQQHPNVAKFASASNADRVVALKDPKRNFPVGQGLSVLRWRLSTKDEGMLPLSITCWPTPRGDGMCDVNIEYELQATHMTLHQLVIAVPLPRGTVPEVGEHSGDWAVNPATGCLEWSAETVNSSNSMGTFEFAASADDVSSFFPVQVNFVSAQSLCEVSVDSATLVESSEDAPFSQEAIVDVDEFVIV